MSRSGSGHGGDLPTDPRAFRVANTLASELVARGASAVLLAGSWARGDAHPESDIDLWAISDHTSYELLRRDGFLIALSHETLESELEALSDPGSVCWAVPGIREAIVLQDPKGAAASLKAEAASWYWEPIAERCDRWTAAQVTGWAEEAHKLVGGLSTNRRWMAAAQRSLLALHLAQVMAVKLRIFYETDNVMWDRVAEAMGGDWRVAQETSFAADSSDLISSCAAALDLYRLAAAEAWDVLNHGQREVVGHACMLGPPVLTSRLTPGPRPWPWRP